MRGFLFKVILFLMMVSFVAPAAAHPHVFAKYDVVVTQKDDKVINLHFTFTIHNVAVPHPLFQDLPIEHMTDALYRHPFQLFLDFDGRAPSAQNVQLARQSGEEEEGVYTYDLEVPAGASFSFAIYDPEYYDQISLNGAHALTVQVKGLACIFTSQEVGQTMWGVNRASHITCGDASKPLSVTTPLKKNRFDHPDFEAVPRSQPAMIP